LYVPAAANVWVKVPALGMFPESSSFGVPVPVGPLLSFEQPARANAATRTNIVAATGNRLKRDTEPPWVVVLKDRARYEFEMAAAPPPERT